MINRIGSGVIGLTILAPPLRWRKKPVVEHIEGLGLSTSQSSAPIPIYGVYDSFGKVSYVYRGPHHCDRIVSDASGRMR